MEHFGKKWSLLFVILLVLGGSTCSFTSVEAGSHTIVIPDDYPTIESALGNATYGDIVFIRNGTYDGPMNQTISVRQSITIMGESREGTIIRLFAAYNESWLFTSCFTTYSDALTLEAENCRIFNLTVIPRGYFSVVGDNVQVIGNNISSGYSLGLSVYGSNCIITDNIYSGYIRLNGSDGYIARNSGCSINIQGSSNVIKNNICQFISLGNATNNVVASNKLSSELGYDGIDIDHSSNNVFVRNSLTWYTFGFRLWYASDNLIVANTIIKCFHSIGVGVSSNNRIYLNNFIQNERWSDCVYDHYTDPPFRNAFPTATVSTNFWDNGAVGNFWQNYTGTDTNGNGIFDSPYELTNVFYTSVGGESSVLLLGQDNYPFTAGVDIATVNVELPDWASSILERNESIIAQPPIEPTIPPSSEAHESQTDQQQLQDQALPITVLIVVAVCVAVIVLVFLKHKKTLSV